MYVKLIFFYVIFILPILAVFIDGSNFFLSQESGNISKSRRSYAHDNITNNSVINSTVPGIEERHQDCGFAFKLNDSWVERIETAIANNERYNDVCVFVCKSYNYSLRIIDNNDQMFVARQKLSTGFWCIRKNLNKCHLSLADAVQMYVGVKNNSKHPEDVLCLSKYPQLFGGKNGNSIIGCNGKIIDRRTNPHTMYKDLVPSTFRLNNVDELTDVGDKRDFAIVCAEARDSRQNLLVPSQLGNRFELIENYCALYLNQTSTAHFMGSLPNVEPNFSNHTCNCGNRSLQLMNIQNDLKRPCTSCYSIHLINQNQMHLSVPCYTLQASMATINLGHLAFFCPPTIQTLFASTEHNLSANYKQEFACLSATIDVTRLESKINLQTTS